VAAPEDIILLQLRAGDLRSFYDAVGILRVFEARGNPVDGHTLREKAQEYGLGEEMKLLLKGEFKWRTRPPGP
jgi:hypothetical protein